MTEIHNAEVAGEKSGLAIRSERPSDKSEQYTNTMNTIKSLIAGGIAGSVAKTVVAPLERVKILFQVHNMPVSIMGSLRMIVEKEGYLALFNGNMAVCVRVFPYSAIQYVSYDYFKHRIYPKDHSDVTAIERMTAGACAGVTAVCCTYPLDLVRVRLACQAAGEQRRYRGMLDCIKKIHAEEGGVKGLYRGATPTVLGVIPYAAINFSTYEFLKVAVLAWEGLCNAEGEPTAATRLGCGAIAGSLGQTVVYPLDTVRRRMQMQPLVQHDPAQSGGASANVRANWPTEGGPGGWRGPLWWRLLVRIVKTEGMRGVFRGITINYIRVVPMVSVSFASYDLLKKAMGVTAAPTKTH